MRKRAFEAIGLALVGWLWWRRVRWARRRRAERAEAARTRRLWAERQSMLASQDDAVKRLLDHWDERYGPDGYTTTMIWDEGGEHSNGWLLGEHYEPDQRRHQGPPLNPYRWDPAGER